MTENRCVCCGEIIPEGRMVCASCDIILERSDCSDKYIECECRKWIVESIRHTDILGFMQTVDEALEIVYESKKDLRNNKLRMLKYISRGLIE